MYIHKYIHMRHWYKHTHIHTYIHTYMHTYIHTYTKEREAIMDHWPLLVITACFMVFLSLLVTRTPLTAPFLTLNPKTFNPRPQTSLSQPLSPPRGAAPRGASHLSLALSHSTAHLRRVLALSPPFNPAHSPPLFRVCAGQ